MIIGDYMNDWGFTIIFLTVGVPLGLTLGFIPASILIVTLTTLFLIVTR